MSSMIGKCMLVARSCETEKQYEGATKYIDLAVKAKKISYGDAAAIHKDMARIHPIANIHRIDYEKEEFVSQGIWL